MALNICQRCRVIYDGAGEQGFCAGCSLAVRMAEKERRDGGPRCFECGAPLSAVEGPIGLCVNCFSGTSEGR